MKKTESLKNYQQFKAVYDLRRAKSNRYFIMFIRKNGTDRNRLGISVSKKAGNSVVRHRLTRLIREAYRLHEEMFNSGLDIVVTVRAGVYPQKGSDRYPLKCADVEKSILMLAGYHKILK